MDSNNPFYEPESVGEFFIIPAGLHHCVVSRMEFIKQDGELKKIEMVFQFPEFSDQTEYNEIKTWFYPSSSYGLYLFICALGNLGVPYEVPDKTKTKKDGKPRRDFTKSLIDEVTGELTNKNVLGKEAILRVFHQWKCPDCGIYNNVVSDKCPGRKGEECNADKPYNVNVYAAIDNQEIYPSKLLKKTDNNKDPVPAADIGKASEVSATDSESIDDSLPF